MGDQSYQAHPDNNNLYITSQGDWTPYSAVSSFNYQLPVDSSLITPISMPTQSPISQGRAPMIQSRRSPNEHSYVNQQMYLNTNQPPCSQATDDTSFSVSPYVHLSPQLEPPTPYFGSYGVSGPATTYSHPPPPPQVQTPILSEPRPRNRQGQSYASPGYQSQPSTPQHNMYQQQSPQNQPRTAWTPPASQFGQDCQYEYMTIPPSQSVSDTSTSMSVHTSDNEEEEIWDGIDEPGRLLITLKQEGHSWKEIARIYAAKTGRTKKVAALQMAYNRLLKKIKAMENEASAIKPAAKHWETDRWSFISSQIFNYSGNSDFWTPSSCEIKWEDTPYGYEDENGADTMLGKRNRKNAGNASRKRSHVDR